MCPLPGVAPVHIQCPVHNACVRPLPCVRVHCLVRDAGACQLLVVTPAHIRCLQIRTIDRVCEIPHEGPFCDLMWSDPEDIEQAWSISPRGAGWLFGKKVTAEFNQINGECLGDGSSVLGQNGVRGQGCFVA